MSKIYDVVICGCGPTGLTAALLLARDGHSVAVLDRHLAVYPLPRAIGYDHEVARILQGLGLADGMSALAATPGVYQWRNRAGELLFELNWAAEASISGFANTYVFSQPRFEELLNQRAREEPLIEIVRGVEIEAIGQDADSVKVTARAQGGEAVTLEARYLVGADGANSLVREQMGSGLVDLGFEADWLVVDVVPRAGFHLPLDDNLMVQVCDPARPTSMVSGGPGRRRWEFMALAHETLEELNCPDRAWELLAPWGVTAQNAELERHAVYRFRGAIARSWREGRMFLAGDAAHLTPPFAGQGLCAGLRDAAAVAWRLDLALKGLASESLLDSYEAERKPHAQAWVINAIELGKVVCVLDEQEAAGRDVALIAARENGVEPPSSGILPRLGPGPNLPELSGGMLALGSMVESAGKQVHFDLAVGNGFILLSRDGHPAQNLSPEAVAILDAIGARAVSLGPDGAVRDTRGAYKAWFDKLGADVALIRPDFYLVGAASGPDAANRLLLSLEPFLRVPHEAR